MHGKRGFRGNAVCTKWSRVDKKTSGVAALVSLRHFVENVGNRERRGGGGGESLGDEKCCDKRILFLPSNAANGRRD